MVSSSPSGSLYAGSLTRRQQAQNQDIVPSPSQFLRRRLAAAVRVGDFLYVNGGQVSYTGDNNQVIVSDEDLTLSLDLSKDWQNTTVNFTSTTKPAELPTLSRGVLWYHQAEDRLYTGFIGDPSDDNPSPAVWTFAPDHKGQGSWSQAVAADSSAFTNINRRGRASTAQGPDTGYALDGMSGGDFQSGILQFNMDDKTFQTLSNAEAYPSPQQEGALQYVPTYGEKGLLIAFGSINAAGKFPTTNTVPVFDIKNQTWYNQTVTGDKPRWRNWYCTAGIQSTNKTFEIFFYGGFDQDGEAALIMDDIHILTLPAFNWIKVPYPAEHPRGSHTCTPVGGAQILVMGGDDSSQGDNNQTQKMATPDPWAQGLNIFNLETFGWQDKYNASLRTDDTYQQSDPVKQFYAANSRLPQNGTDPHIMALLSGSNSSMTNTSAPFDPGPENTPIPAQHHTNKGAIAGGVVGGVAGLALILTALLLLYRRRYRKPDDSAKATLDSGYTSHGSSGVAEVHGDSKKMEMGGGMGGEDRQEMGGLGRLELGGKVVHEAPGSSGR